MEEKVSDWLFNFGADHEIVEKAERLEREHERYRVALEANAKPVGESTLDERISIAREALRSRLTPELTRRNRQPEL